MKILVLNAILFTAEHDVIPDVKTIKDVMAYDLCLGFKSLGHDVTLVAADDYRPSVAEDYDFEVVFMRSAMKRVFKPSVLPYLPGLSRFLKDRGRQFDMIVTSEVFSLLTWTAVRQYPEKTLIWQEMNVLQRRFFGIPARLWHSVVVRCLFGRKAVVVARSVAAQAFIRRFYVNVADDIVEHGINQNKFKCLREKKRQMISTAQLVRRKRVDKIVANFARLHAIEGYEDVKLLIANRGVEKENLKSMVEECGLSDSVEFLGFLSQAELNRHIRESMCMLISTSRDLNIVSIPEAIVSGTPILTNSTPLSAWYVDKYKLGIVRDEWDESQMMEIIDQNGLFVGNCCAYRNNLTNEGAARHLVDIFLAAH